MQEPLIIYEDPRFVGVNKPAGWVVHSVSGVKRQAPNGKILTDWLREKYPEIKTVGDDPKTRPGIVHRLDKDVSGVMVVARSQDYFEYLKKLFQEHRVKKFYYALVAGEVKKRHGFIDTPIGVVAGSVKRSIFSHKLEKEALTEYRVLKKIGDGLTLLEIQTHTGRTHQIRVHLASIGHPIVGDALYGKSALRPGLTARVYLHAFRVEFATEAGKTLRLEAGLPEEFKKALVLPRVG